MRLGIVLQVTPRGEIEMRETVEYQRKVSGFVAREIWCRALINSEDFPGHEEHLINAFAGPIGYEEAATDAGWTDKKEGGEILYICEGVESWAESWEDLCHQENINVDNYQREVLEHWVISGYLARKLEEHGETVFTFLGLTIWGRATTGQSIAMDAVICDIYDTLYIEDTQ
jgi:hypothetical protein